MDNLREILVTELVKCVLGPRNGLHETLANSPMREYISGVLSPIPDRDGGDKDFNAIDDDAEIPSEDTVAYEEGISEVDVTAPPLIYPALDPKSKPSTMGISFVVFSEKTPKVKVCLTWARYRPEISDKSDAVEGSGGFPRRRRVLWHREPRFASIDLELDDRDTILWIDHHGNSIRDPSKAEISFHSKIRDAGDHRCYFHLYLVNRMKPANWREYVPKHIFQPQIRVTCDEGTRLVPGIRKTPEREEESMLDFLYSEKPALARGHLCSVVWKEIDPENQTELDVNLDFPECLTEPPFAWTDGKLLPDHLRNQFSPPHLRTEFVPIYSIPFPELGWRKEYGNEPELRAIKIAEKWNPEDMRNSLSPFVESYEKWIDAITKWTQTSIPKSRIKVAQGLVEDCRTALNRIRSGIDLVCEDNDAKLAFCLANKAIDTQWKWEHTDDFKWHPFQMAFILAVLESMVNPQSPYRNTCDVLWVPTGTGKTEAYLALVAFSLALRRVKALKGSQSDLTGAGISVITRYTLRLLTIQQFRRTLSVITALESLRVLGLARSSPVGWRPADCNQTTDFLWGSTPFSIGLWVGQGVSPNRLRDIRGGNQLIPGALSILKGQNGYGEPAQVLNCPACKAILAVPEMGFHPGSYTIHFVIRTKSRSLRTHLEAIVGEKFHGIRIKAAEGSVHHRQEFYTVTIKFEAANIIEARDIENLWNFIAKLLETKGCSANLVAINASRPGYFSRFYIGARAHPVEYDFEILCPNPKCPLHKPWCGGGPSGWIHGKSPQTACPSPDGIAIPLYRDGNKLTDIQDQFMSDSHRFICDRIPIPALTVDEQIYMRLPSVVVATVDKFARPPFEPRASSLFGNVDFHHSIFGFYRVFLHSSWQNRGGPHPGPNPNGRVRLQGTLKPPDLVIQDELHLIEGPLGSLLGLYETAFDYLCQEGREWKVKYIASSATVRRAKQQVLAVFQRDMRLFPPHGVSADDSFFINHREMHALDDDSAGRLYLGLCAPGRGPHTPLVRTYSQLLQTVWENRTNPDIDTFWTLTGYFNAVRELAGARALYRQDIPQRVKEICPSNIRPLGDERGRVEELSGRIQSTNLPSILDSLKLPNCQAPDVLFTTSMFGTGVNIPRIGLMVVNGQPKTTSAYIQSTGRVGRAKGALVITFLRAARPRDLSHYEFFIGYHRQLHRFVEPTTVYPFSSGVLERAAGPVAVFILRNMKNATTAWYQEQTSTAMATQRSSSEVQDLTRIFEARSQDQPKIRKPPSGKVTHTINSKLDVWQQIAANNRNLKFVEYAINTPPTVPVVLGDYQHLHAHFPVVYENAPNSLREIEETTGFQTR